MISDFEKINREIITIDDIDLIDIDTTMLKHFSERENELIELIDERDAYHTWESPKYESY